MAQIDLQAFLIQRLGAWDPTADLTPGSPLDVQVIQPVLRRLGTDPFSTDLTTFILARLNQEFPTMPTQEGDAITDLLVKTNSILWNPIIQEIQRVRNNLSFKDPTILTLEEAESLGANLFAPRNTGDFARGVGRIYFAQPQNISITPANYFTSKDSLNFFPTDVQSLSVSEMLLNTEEGLYYFDVNTVAEGPGDQYNIGPDELTNVANVASAVRVKNKLRFRFGVPDEGVVEYVDRIQQELTERSLVTERGIVATITKNFSEVTRLASTGFNDPEMQRDVIRGGGFGPILSAGILLAAVPDGENAVGTRRVTVTDLGVDFTTLIGPTGQETPGFVLTLINAFLPATLPIVRDIKVLRVVDATTLDLEDQAISYIATGISWILRKVSLTLSGIPGGILFPNTPDGSIELVDDQIHIGGTTDVYVRGTGFDDAALALSSVVDDNPLTQGVKATVSDATHLLLTDYVLAPALGANYSVGDAVYTALERAKTEGLSIQLLDPPNAGSFRVLDVLQSAGMSPLVAVTPTLNVVVADFRWRITDELDIDLAEPKETKISGSDLQTVQGTDVVQTASGVDFDNYGVGAGDILRISTGKLVLGDYNVVQVVFPFYTHIQVDRKLPATLNGLKYTIFRKNTAGGLVRPFVRINSIDLLDTSAQPTGTSIPYASPIDVQTQGFANVARGVKSEFTDGVLGLVTVPLTLGANVNGLTITIAWDGTSPLSFSTSFIGVNPMPLATLVTQINLAASTATAGVITRLAVLLDNGERIGLLPVYPNVRVTAGTSRLELFGDAVATPSSRDINSQSVFGLGGWAALSPTLDRNFDVAQVLDGLQIGFYGGLTVPNNPFVSLYDPLRTVHDFNPEARRHLQVGARSLGTARVYFSDPTSFEIDSETVFQYTSSIGSELRFLPDPTNSYQRIPALPSGAKPHDGLTGVPLANNIFESASMDFVAQGIQPGDLLSIDYVPMAGITVLADPVPNLALKKLTVSISGGVDKDIIFLRDSIVIPVTDVTRQGVVDQINKTVGKVICSINSFNNLEFDPEVSIIVRGSSAAGSANGALGFAVIDGKDGSNDSLNIGTYTITVVAPGSNASRLQVTPVFPSVASPILRQQYKVFRAGLQRIVSTDMAKNVGTAGLYYFDAQLISEGTGDQYNLSSNLQMTIKGYRSDGYYLTTEDPNLSFSPVERPMLHVSKSILAVGVSDSPSNATQISGQNLLLNYSRSSITDNVHSFISSDTERVINDSPLGRHLIPHFVRFSVSYVGGSAESVVLPDLEKFILGLYPNDYLESSDIQKLINNRGARSVENPIDLIAVVHNVDRTITVERSQDKLNTGRLAAFVPDQIQLNRRTT